MKLIDSLLHKTTTMHQSISLRLRYHKLTGQIQSYTASDQSKPNLQILLWRNTAMADDVLHRLGSFTWMYKVCWDVGKGVILSPKLDAIQCRAWLAERLRTVMLIPPITPTCFKFGFICSGTRSLCKASMSPSPEEGKLCRMT